MPHIHEENFAHFLSLTSEKARSQFLSTLTTEKLLGLYSVNTFVEGEKISPLLSWPPTLLNASLQPSQKPTQLHANLLYASLYHTVKAAQAKAKEEGKPFQLIVGDIHGDRTALLPCSMLLHIANRLGIRQVGTEVPEEGVLHYPFGVKKGLKEQLQAISQGIEVPELGGNAYGKTRNFDFLIEQAVQLGLKEGLFANDPDSIVTPEDLDLINNPETRQQRLYTRRGASMQDILQQKQDCISFYGIGHLQGLQDSSQSGADVSQLIISTANCYVYSNEANASPLFNGFTFLPTDLEKAKAIGRGERDGESPLVQAWVNGDLNTKDEALAMAAAADKAVGRKLSPLPQEQEQERYR